MRRVKCNGKYALALYVKVTYRNWNLRVAKDKYVQSAFIFDSEERALASKDSFHGAIEACTNIQDG